MITQKHIDFSKSVVELARRHGLAYLYVSCRETTGFMDSDKVSFTWRDTPEEGNKITLESSSEQTVNISEQENN